MTFHRWQTWLTAIGVMLAVAMIVGVDLANSSARRAFELSLESITGATTHQIIGGPQGIPESVYTRLRTDLGLRTSAPMVTGQVSIEGEHFYLLGVDPIAEASLGRHTAGLEVQGLASALLNNRAVMLSQRSADSLGLQKQDSFELIIGHRAETVTLVTVFQADNPAASEGILFTDIAVAQNLLNRNGRLDRIDLILPEKGAAALREWLPDGLKLVQSEARNDNLRQMSEAFHINLTAMSFLALLVAALLIYNTVTLSVIRRRNTLGIYRALGVTGREIFTLVVTESLALALIASLAGILLGLILGQVLVQLVTRTVNDLYFSLHVSSFLFDPLSLLKGLSMGMGTALLASLIPAWEASRNMPVSLLQRSTLEQRWRKKIPLSVAAGTVMLALGFAIISPERGTLLAGFTALTLMVIGFCLFIPALLVVSTKIVLQLLNPILNNTARIAIRDIAAGISRSGMAVAALTVAISVTVGVGVMVNSFRETVDIWLGQYLSADVYVATNGDSEAVISTALIEQLNTLPAVATVSISTMVSVETEFGPLRLLALSTTENDTRLPIKSSDAQTTRLSTERFNSGQGIMISEPLAYRHQLQKGDSITITTAYGEKTMQVLDVFYDYSSSSGIIAINHETYKRQWRDNHISSLSIYGHVSSTQEELLKQIKKFIKDKNLSFRVRSNREIREIALTIFDRTFEITGVLRILAVIVAFVSVLSALMALQLERSREFAILRALGMTPGQIATMILGQTGFMGLLAGLLSIPLGLLMADLLIEVINRRSFGWSMLVQIPTAVLIEALILAISAALLAAVYPSRRAAMTSPAQALREE